MSDKGRGSDTVNAEALGVGRRIVPANTQEFKEWIKSGRSFILVDPELAQRVFKKNMQDTLDIAIASLSPWISDVGSPMSVASAESFRSDLRRKLMGIAESIKGIVKAEVSECINYLGVIGEVREQDAEKRAKGVSNCLGVIDKGPSTVLAMLIAMDGLMGVSQANLPLGIMPNIIKGRVGFFTD